MNKQKLEYCPVCGEKAELKKDGVSNYLGCKSNHKFYINPNPTVSAIIYDGPKILLSKRGIDPHRGKWDLINGFIEVSETPVEAVHREVKEETGLEFQVEDLLGFNTSDYYLNNLQKNLNIYFSGAVDSPSEIKTSDELQEARWFNFDEIPYEDFGFEHHIGVIKEFVDLNSGCAGCEFRDQCDASE